MSDLAEKLREATETYAAMSQRPRTRDAIARVRKCHGAQNLASPCDGTDVKLAVQHWCNAEFMIAALPALLDAVDALEFYADKKNYRRGSPFSLEAEYESPHLTYVRDEGTKARAALERLDA